MNDVDETDYFDEAEHLEERPRDEAIDEAKPVLMGELFDALLPVAPVVVAANETIHDGKVFRALRFGDDNRA